MSVHLEGRRVGLALSGGSVRGIAHIGIVKALAEYGIKPAVVAGTSVGSIIGAGIAAGMDWQQLKEMAEAVFWPSLLNGGKLDPRYYLNAAHSADLLVQPDIPITVYVPGVISIDRLIAAGEAATHRALRKPIAQIN